MGAAVLERKENEATGTGSLCHGFLTVREQLGTLAGDGVPLLGLRRGWGKGHVKEERQAKMKKIL